MKGWHGGEWLEPSQNIFTMIKIASVSCPETATAYMYYSCKLMSHEGLDINVSPFSVNVITEKINYRSR